MLGFTAVWAVSNVVRDPEREAEAERVRRETQWREQAQDAVRREHEQKVRIADAQRDAKTIADELLGAGIGDFDAKRRDQLARRVLEIDALLRPPRRHDLKIDELLYRSGAHDVLLERGPGDKEDYWYEVAVRHQAWDRIIALPPDAVTTNAGGRALCLAGARERAIAFYEEFVDIRPPNMYVAWTNAVACGVPTSRSSYPAGSVAAAREVPHLEHVAQYAEGPPYSDKMAVLAMLFREDEVPSFELIEAASGARLGCHDPWNWYAAETASPETFLAAADKLALEDDPSPDLATRDLAVERLRWEAVHAGVALERDLRHLAPNDPNVPEAEHCLDMITLHFDLDEGIARLRAKIDRTPRAESASTRSDLALALAHAGRFDEAFEVEREAVEIRLEEAREKRFRRVGRRRIPYRGRWHLLIALAHRTQRLGELRIERIDPKLEKFLDAITGPEAARRQLRLDGASPGWIHPVVQLYLQGAIAPGHEEEYLDTLWLRDSPAAGYLARAEAARWRGDSAAAELWDGRRRTLRERVAGGENGGLHLFLSNQ